MYFFDAESDMDLRSGLHPCQFSLKKKTVRFAYDATRTAESDWTLTAGVLKFICAMDLLEFLVIPTDLF